MSPAERFPIGNYAPAEDEHTVFDLTVQGALPVALRGTYVRTGPNPRADLDGISHWPSAPGMLHGLALAGGQASWYRRRWVRSPELARADGLTATQAPPALVPDGTGNANVVAHAGRLLAWSDMALPFALNAQLETRHAEDFGGPMPAGSISHPRVDPATGEMHTLAFHFDAPYLRHHRIDARGHLVGSREIDLQHPVLIHDFGLTPRHLVFFDLPALFSEEAMFEGHPMPYRWSDSHGARVGLLSRLDPHADVQWFDLPPCWISHVANAWEADGVVMVDAICHASLDDDTQGDSSAVAALGAMTGPAELIRCTLDAARSAALVETLDHRQQEFPVMDQRHAGQRARHLWTTAQSCDAAGQPVPAGRCLYHHDLLADQVHTLTLPRDQLIGEVCFVPSHGRAAEGEGWLLAFSHDERSRRSALVVLDAAATSYEETARIELPQAVPWGLHGCWVPAG